VQDGGAGVAGNPTFSNQVIKTTVVVSDQSTITLGGLIQEDKSDQKGGVPLLMNIPVIGRAFAYNQLKNSRKELFVILRPQIVYGDQRDSATMKAMREKFAEVTKMLQEVGL
jgi:general secretion pathway protein D